MDPPSLDTLKAANQLLESTSVYRNRSQGYLDYSKQSPRKFAQYSAADRSLKEERERARAQQVTERAYRLQVQQKSAMDLYSRVTGGDPANLSLQIARSSRSYNNL